MNDRRKRGIRLLTLIIVLALLGFRGSDTRKKGVTSVEKYNHLSETKSPYLLQHKDNPVHWFPWGAEAFQAALEENKIIFLSIGYSTCYWCHMMEKDSFEKQEVADLLNQNFISIKVDREEHPDVDQMYMDAVVGMTGQGGWPMSVFLTPDLKPFFGGTFFWRDQFLQILDRVHQAWGQDPNRISESGEKILKFLKARNTVEAGSVGDELLKKAFQQYNQNFDPVYGGFGGAPKFPYSLNHSLLLRIHRRSGNPKALEMATKTLDGMAKAEIYDKIGGGFHRYATKEDWNEPHFEKMLYDNALLVWTYLEAYQVTKNKRYSEIVRQTLDYILREMTDPNGGFYSAQDAGEVGKEGEYYHWSKEERAKRTSPHKDDKILTSWNGLMIAAMAKGYQILGEKRYLEAAQAAAGFIQKNLFKEGRLLRRFREGDARFEGTLDDYVFLIHGLLALYESDFNSQWIAWARELQSRQEAIFWDQKEGGYFLSDPKDQTVLVKKKDFHDGAVPSGNGMAAYNLLRLFGFTFEADYFKRAEKLLGVLAGSASRTPSGFAQALIAIDYYLDRSKEIAVIGKPEDPATQAIRKYLYQNFIPNKVVAFGNLSDPKTLPLLEGKPLLDNQTTIYVCEKNICKLPTNDWTQAKELIRAIKEYKL